MRVRDVATAATLARCIAHARRRHPHPDAVLLTGDLVHDDPAGYAQLATHFRGRRRAGPLPAGQPRRPRCDRAALEGAPFVHDVARRYGDWMIVMLDSTIAGEHGGHLDAEELARLDAALAAQPDALCARLPASPSGSARQRLARRADARQRGRVLCRARAPPRRARPRLGPYAPAVRGHARPHPPDGHALDLHAVRAERRRVRDRQPPARYRWIELGPGGGIETGIEWVDEYA